MEPPTGPKLLQQAEKILLRPIHPHLISYCPTMDLIALVTDEESLDVYRINGQRAFCLKRKSSTTTVDSICWEFNGQAIAVAWSDGFTDIISSETGKVIHKDLAPPAIGPGKRRIQCVGWGLNFIDVDAVKRRIGIPKQKTDSSGISINFTASTTDGWDTFQDDTTLEDFLQRQPDLQTLDIAPDLPEQLAMMDIETLLPKLPPIPSPPMTPFMRLQQQAESSAFGTQAQVDAILHSQHMKDQNSVDMFIRCTDVGTVHPSIYDSLETVNVHLPENWGIEKCRPILHTSHPYSCSHSLLMEVKSGETTKLAFVPLTLGFIPSAGIYLHLIASKTAQLQNLLLYIQQCLQRIQSYWRHSQELPSKLMMNFSETLENKDQGNLVQNLYQLACTGYCPPVLKEWLVDELQEAGHKRWDTAVMSSLTTILALIHENLLPAIDRCTIILSRLRGLAEYHDQNWIFNAPATTFTSLLTHLQNLRLLAHTTLLYGGDEKRQFEFFSKWLRYEIDLEATELESSSREEMENKDPGVDIGMVLEYIRYPLTQSDLAPYLRPKAQLSSEQQKSPAASYDETRKAIDLLKEGAHYKEEALCLEHVLIQFSTNCTKLFQQISQWQESHITMSHGLVLESDHSTDTESHTLDMRMVFEVSCLFPRRERPHNAHQENKNYDPKTGKKPTNENDLASQFTQLTLSEPHSTTTISTFIAYAPRAQTSELRVHKLTHTPTIDELPRTLHAYAATVLRFDGYSIQHLRFVDDKILLLLLRSASNQHHHIVCLPYNTPMSPSPAYPLPYTPLTLPLTHSFLPTGTATPLPARQIVNFTNDRVAAYTRHVFEKEFTPLRLVVNGMAGRRVVLVLGDDRKHYRVLDLDYRGVEEGDVRAREKEGSSGDGDGDGDVEMGG
ncbi:hypothetical protein CC78DRAFT_341092 [Lojkania enalia]|uniref:Anaphase-promoting complex subunit 4 n=1 Tax=Lojkania enalia TaxID=147567 RepID=A0A9P4K6D5_9PLEO|nr:hypothetical protein CC78DRAFT_341092 [Didymosphaeria enalia]